MSNRSRIGGRVMKKERQKTENEKLFEFAKELRDVVADIDIFTDYLADLERLPDNNLFFVEIQTSKRDNKLKLQVDNNFIGFLSQFMKGLIEKKKQELNELKKHITL